MLGDITASLPHVVCVHEADVISDGQASITPMRKYLQQAINCVSDPPVSHL